MLCCFLFLCVEQHLWSILSQFIIMHQEPSHLLQWWVGNSFKGHEFWNSWFSRIFVPNNFQFWRWQTLSLPGFVWISLMLTIETTCCVALVAEEDENLKNRLNAVWVSSHWSLLAWSRPTDPLITNILWQMLLAGETTRIWKHTSTTGHVTSLGLLDSTFVVPLVG